ncbi:MAG: carboxypeptidase regulatory-like domain-containing protein [Acidobacteria bacterium]|nr:MAG: carboxypeptidase regulatory-like domain-containing protein [Acidobacteriota bacterium]
MRTHRIVLLAALIGLAASVLGYAPCYAKDKGDSGRLLTGRVTDKQEAPLGGAVVYLSNTRTRAVKTFIAGQDGVYRFPALSPSIDYEVYAQFEGHKSDTKTMSQFDTRPTVNINLRIDTK